MRYKKFEIHNFRGISELVLNLDECPWDIYTLVGLNESWKTTILEAINQFYSKDISWINNCIPKALKSNFTDSIKLIAHIKIDTEDKQDIQKIFENHWFEIDTDKVSDFIIKREFPFVSTKPQWENLDFWLIWYWIKKQLRKSKTPISSFIIKDKYPAEWQLIIKDIFYKLLPEVIYYQDFLNEFPESIILNTEDFEKGTVTHKYYCRVLQDVLDAIWDWKNLKEHIVNRMKSTILLDKESLDSTLNQMKGKMTEVLIQGWQELMGSKDLRINIKSRTIPKETLANWVEIPEKHILEIVIEDWYETYKIHERSLWFQWFFIFLLFTEFRKYRNSWVKHILFLLDEPASNLHSSAQTKILDTLGKLTLNWRHQLTYTTHSHYLINPNWLASTYVVKNNAIDITKWVAFNTANTDIKATRYPIFASQNPKQKEYFQPILSVLDYQPGLLEKIPSVILCEWKHDAFVFEYFKTILNKKDLVFYPGWWAWKNIDFLRLYIAWWRKFIVFQDSDDAGDKGVSKYMEEFWELVKDKIFNYKTIDPMWDNYSIESLFTEADKKLIIDNTYPGAKITKDNLHKWFQYLLATKKNIIFSEESTNKISSILDFFWKKL